MYPKIVNGVLLMKEKIYVQNDYFENLLYIYCLMRHINKEQGVLYWQLVDIFGKRFIKDWKSLFHKRERKMLPNSEEGDPVIRLDVLEKKAILIALERNDFVQKKAAQDLGISERSLSYKITYKYKITKQDFIDNLEW
jgi:transcriptional regulator with GAF, ATPase, and Fis domain